jgi:UDP-N-acetylmuramate-alanine ligase
MQRSERAERVSHATGARRRSGARERVWGSPRGEAPRIIKDAREGDLVVVVSNGGFEDIHRKLLAAIEGR